MRSPVFCETYRTDPDALFLIGHSMGGSNVLQAARRMRGLRGLVLLTPYDPTAYLRQGREEALLPLLETGRILHSDGLDAILRDMRAHVEEYSFAKTFPEVKDQNLLVITGTLDTIAPAWMVTPLWEQLTAHPTSAVQRLVELPAAHGLCGCRIAAVQAVAAFMNDVLTG